VVHLTQALADHFSAGIAKHPEDWHMLQPLFLADLAVDGSKARS
jgi:KDO2-lipid IV(A) lauroyltransferase